MKIRYRVKMLTLVLFVNSAFIIGCTDSANNESNESDDSTNTVQVDEELLDDINMAKQVFYSLPSPIETAMLMKRAGAKYDETLLNPTENRTKYSTNQSMSLNLGVYSADLSFASMFDQSQTTIKYITACKKLAEDLGILDAISKATIDRMETNINNRDSLMEIISETFMNSNSFLKENDRASTAAVILIGGWVEGLYIASRITQSTQKNEELVNRIIDQRLSLATLLSLLAEYEGNQNIDSMIAELKSIEEVFKKIKVTSSAPKAIVDEKTKKTIIKSTTVASISPEVFKELCEKVNKLRTKIVS